MMMKFRDFIKADIVRLETCALFFEGSSGIVGPYLFGDIDFIKFQYDDSISVSSIGPTYSLSSKDRNELVRLAYLGYSFATMYIILIRR